MHLVLYGTVKISDRATAAEPGGNMSDSLDERRKAQEDTYFQKKNREALERLSKKQSDSKPLVSPVSGQPMMQEVFHGVVIDRCAQSGGVWLDAGELEQLMESAVKEAEAGGLVGFFKGLAGKK